MAASWLFSTVAAACLGAVGETSSDFAGKYRCGMGGWAGVSYSLTLTPDGRFAYDGFGCVHIVGLPEGTYAVKAGHLVLHTERGEVDRDTPTDFVIIRWGDRLYLIPSGEEHAKDFCNSINLGEEPRWDDGGSHYLREGDWAKAVTGLPDVPAAWSRFLIKRPLMGEVIGLRNGGQATINLGSEDGVWEGMKLHVDEEKYDLARVVSVREHSSVVSSGIPEYPRTFKVGQKVRSRLPSSDRTHRPRPGRPPIRRAHASQSDPIVGDPQVGPDGSRAYRP